MCVGLRIKISKLKLTRMENERRHKAQGGTVFKFEASLT